MGTNIINNTVRQSIVSSVDFAYNYASSITSSLVFTVGSSISGANNSFFLGNYIESTDTVNSIILGEHVTTNDVNNSIVLGTVYGVSLTNIERCILMGQPASQFNGTDYKDAIVLLSDVADKPKTLFTTNNDNPSFVNSNSENGFFGVGTGNPVAKLHVKATNLRALILEGLPVANDDVDAAAVGVIKAEVYQTPTGELRIKL